MQSINQMAERLRDLLESPRGLELPGCYDVLSAMVLERAGFPAVFMSSYGIAASFLGNPDIGLTTLVETALLAKNISRSVHVPVVVDADNGYGNEDNVVRTVFELEQAGAAAMILQDQVFPKRCGHASGKPVIPLDQYMRKLECALGARQTPLVVVARTEATSIDQAIIRAKQFHAAGADVTLVDGLSSVDALKRVGAEVLGRKMINLIHGGKTPLLASDQLHELGFKVVLYSTPALFTAMDAMLGAMKLLRESRRLDSIGDRSVSFQEFQEFIEDNYFRRRESAGLSRGAGQGGISRVPSQSGYRVAAGAMSPEEAAAIAKVRSIGGRHRGA
jgi:2-methylisocitrate lyase-like PEP mutase family enzyme